MDKSRKRGLRRYRSFSKWMSRLKNDWATHGRQYSVHPIYEYVDGKPVKIVGWRDTLCKCFDLKNKQAYRFKDTPTLDHSQRKDNSWDPHPRYARDERRLPVEREYHGGGGNKPPPPSRRVRVSCRRCGYLLGMVDVKRGESRYHMVEKAFGNAYYNLCERCRARHPGRLGMS
jgi:hypothetical protein